MAWQRCGKSPFYRNLDDETTPFHSGFLDPVDLVLVRTWPRRDGSVGLRRQQLIDFTISSVHDNFMKEAAARIDAWFDRITRDAEGGDLRWKTAALADLDVDAVQRDILLDALEVMVDLQIGRVEVDDLQVPKGGMAKGLAEMGVPRC